MIEYKKWNDNFHLLYQIHIKSIIYNYDLL